MATTLGIQEVKAHLSELVERAGRGEEIVVTKRGKPVATITEPPRQGSGVRHFGFLPLDVSSDLLAPMTPEELAEWGIE
jgi:antitoxin (DNA-binding transcriptional repressor) of toxin-antitoxin stability system